MRIFKLIPASSYTHENICAGTNYTEVYQWHVALQPNPHRHGQGHSKHRKHPRVVQDAFPKVRRLIFVLLFTHCGSLSYDDRSDIQRMVDNTADQWLGFEESLLGGRPAPLSTKRTSVPQTTGLATLLMFRSI